MFCIPSLVVISCAIKLSFVDYYRAACYEAPKGQYWAGARGELTDSINKRVLNAVALYTDYAEERREKCGHSAVDLKR
jgi:hypothetical protein